MRETRGERERRDGVVVGRVQYGKEFSSPAARDPSPTHLHSSADRHSQPQSSFSAIGLYWDLSATKRRRSVHARARSSLFELTGVS